MNKTDKNVRHQDQTGSVSKQQVKTKQIVSQQIKSESTPKPEIRSETSQEFFLTYKQNVEKYFDQMEQSIPKYYQTLSELQQEFLQAWENMFNASIAVQKEFSSKTGLDSKQSSIASKFVSDTTEAAIRARTVRDKIFLTSIDTTKENIKEWNRRSQEFADLNRRILQSWVSSFTARKN